MIKKRNTPLIVGLICIFWLMVIFFFSSMNSESSKGLTEIALNIVHTLRDRFPFIDRLFCLLTQKKSIFYIIRKIAHVLVFCTLQILTFIFFKSRGYSFEKCCIYSILGVIVYACTDEFHQLFISGRSGQIKDIFIDTFGGLIGISLCYLFSLIFKIQKYIRSRLFED